MSAFVENLAVALDDRFGDRARRESRERIEAAGCVLVERIGLDDRTLAWIDGTFGGTWSREAFRAQNVVATRDGDPVGFASFAPQGLRFFWLQGLAKNPGVGVFGPFGVAQTERGGAIGSGLLTLALCALRRLGYSTAIVPAVGSERLAGYYARTCGAYIVERHSLEAGEEAPVRTVVMASGAGTNFSAVADAVAQHRLSLEIVQVVAGRSAAGVRERARAIGVAESVVPWQRHLETREQYGVRLRKVVTDLRPELVLLLGWMHVLDASFVDAFSAILNLHPAFLPHDPSHDTVGMPDGTHIPVFRGPAALRDAVRAGSRWTGSSVHRVTADADRGEIVMRVPMPMEPEEPEERAYERLREVEHALVPRAIRAWTYER
ncbi:MAG: GNAT family N-acetyltransferase [Candidatus Tyrphobacter sp.]